MNSSSMNSAKQAVNAAKDTMNSAKTSVEHAAEAGERAAYSAARNMGMVYRPWNRYMMYAAAGFASLYVGMWAMRGQRPHISDMIPFARRQEHKIENKIDGAVHDARRKADDVASTARMVGERVESKANDLGAAIKNRAAEADARTARH